MNEKSQPMIKPFTTTTTNDFIAYSMLDAYFPTVYLSFCFRVSSGEVAVAANSHRSSVAIDLDLVFRLVI